MNWRPAALDDVLVLARHIPLFPCRPKAETIVENGQARTYGAKSPLTRNGFHDATQDAAQITDWWTRYPDALVGVPTGRPTGLVVIDEDRYKHDAASDAWIAEHTNELLAARIHVTGSDGRHYVYRENGQVIANGAGVTLDGVHCKAIDVRANGGYVIWWPAHGCETLGAERAPLLPATIEAHLARTRARPTEPNATADPILRGLADRGLYLRRIDAGRHAVACPWASEHTTDSTDSSTAVLLPHYNGYAEHVFKCQHTHCGKRTIRDLREYLGLATSPPDAERFPSLEVIADDGTPPKKAPTPKDAWSEEPLDFLRQTVAPAFDASDVPDELAQFATEWARAAGFDASGVIAATVGAAAAMLSDGLRLKVQPASDYYESARLWVLLIGPPGVAKSPSISAATQPVKTIHRELFNNWQQQCERLKSENEASDEPLVLPPRPALFTSDATTEALAEILAANERGLLFLNEEFESWLGQHDAYRNGGKDRGEWLRAFDGGPHQVDRIKRGAFFVPNWGLSILSATTPSALQKLSRKLPADGLLQRFLPVLVQPGCRADACADVTVLARAYHKTCVRLYDYGPLGEVRLVTMTHEAADLLREERERLRSLALAVQVYGDGFAGHVAKHAALLARIALTFHALTGREHPAERPLAVEAVLLAARFMDKAFRHAQVLYGDLLGHEGAVSLARAVAAVLLADKRLDVTRRDLARSCHAWRRADDERQRDEAMQFLVDVGWLHEEHGEYVKPHVTRWSINPAVHDQFGTYGEKHRERRQQVRNAIREAAHEAR